MSTPWGHDAVLALRQIAAESHLLQFGELASGELLLARLVQGANPLGVERGNTLRMTASQAEWFVRTTEVVAQYENDNAGLSVTLMRDRASGQWQLALRGTEFLPIEEGGDWERDGIAGADGQLARYGLALLQLDHLRRVFEEWQVAYGLGDESLTVTGYSLGVHLAAGFTELYPDAVAEAVGFNGPTRGSWAEGASLGEILDFHRAVMRNPLLGLELLADDPRLPELIAAADVADDPVLLTNAYNDVRTSIAALATGRVYHLTGLALGSFEGQSLPEAVTSRFRLVVGQAAHGDRLLISGRGLDSPTEYVLIEDQPDVAGLGGFLDGIGSFGHTHSLVLLLDSLLVHDFIARMAPGLDRYDIEMFVEAASLQRAEGYLGFTDQALVEGDSLERAVDAWRRLFLGDETLLLPWRAGLTGYGDLDARSTLHAAMEELLGAHEGDAASAVTPLIHWAGIDGGPAALAARAVDSLALRYALWSLTPFALEDESLLLAAPGRQERLEALDADYLTLRADFADAFWRRAQSVSDPALGGLGLLSLRYQDLTAGIDLFDRDTDPRVVFGSIGSDVVAGSGRGDVLFGDDGADRLGGGEGADRLFGGLGDDHLDGGAGADHLEGGQGFDLYIAGDGDTVRDTGGQGRVRFSGEWLGAGLVTGEADVWRTWNASVEYRLEGEALVVERRVPGAIGLLGPTFERLQILDWSPGDLGIRLLDRPLPSVSWFGDGGPQRVDVYDDGLRFVVGAIAGDPQALQRFALESPASVRSLGFIAAPGQIQLRAGNQIVVLHDPAPGPLLIHLGEGEDVLTAPGVVGEGTLLQAELGGGHDRFSGGEAGETVSGGEGDDFLRGNGGDDTLTGDAGADLIAGGTGHDLVAGGSGDDLLLGGPGHDVIEGGQGSDLLFGDAEANALAWIGGELLPSSDVLYPQAMAGASIGGFAFLSDRSQGGNDWLIGGAGNDNLFGGGGDDHLEGGDGADLLQGESGDDWLEGGDGNDILIGDEGAEQRADQERLIEGIAGAGFGGASVPFYLRDASAVTAGNDRLDGGAGNDILRGGHGNDTYLFAHKGGEDLLIDSGGVDRLLLEGRSSDWYFAPDFFPPGSKSLLVVSLEERGFFNWNLARLSGWFDVDASARIETIIFEDGETWQEADIRAAIPERELLEPGMRWVSGRGGSYYSLAELIARDAVYFVQGGEGFDVIDLRAGTVDPALAGVAGTTLRHLRREGMDLIVEALASLPTEAPPIVLHGMADAITLAQPAAPSPAAEGDSGSAAFTLVLEGFFQQAHHVEAIVLDDGIVGLAGTAPVAGTAALEPFVNPGAQLHWQLPADAFLDDPADVLGFSLDAVDGTGLPAWLGFDVATGRLEAHPGPDVRGLFAFTLTATGLAGMSTTRSLVLNVGMPVAPVFTQRPEPLRIAISAAGTIVDVPWRIDDVNAGDTVTVDVLDRAGRSAAWVELRAGGLWLRPGLFDAGVYELRVRARDADGLVVEAPLRIEVLAPGEPGAIDGRPAGEGVILIGTAAVDRLTGGPGDDLVHAGPGDDRIFLGGGRDLIHLAPGDGVDTLDLAPGGEAIVELALGADASQLTARFAPGDEALLELRHADGPGLDLPALFEREWHAIDGEVHQLDVLRSSAVPGLTLRYAEGEPLSLADVLLGTGPVTLPLTWYARPGSEAAAAASLLGNAGLRLLGTAGDDALVGSPLADRLYGGAGDDRLEGKAGDDRLYGGEGDDRIEAGAGDDWLSGGSGDDTLLGGAGNDNYLLSRGGGQDHLEDRSGLNALWLVDGATVTGFALQGQDVRLLFDDESSLMLVGGLDAGTIAWVHRADTPSSEPRSTQAWHDFLRELGWGHAAPAARADVIHLRVPAGGALAGLDLGRYFSAGDSERLHFSLGALSGGPENEAHWLSLDGTTGLLTGTAARSHAGLWQWRIEARDPLGQSASTMLELLVDDSSARFGSARDDRLDAGGEGASLHGLAGNDELRGGAGADALHGGSGTDYLDGGDGDDLLYWSADRAASPFDRLVPGNASGQASLALEGRWLSEDILIGGAGEDALIGTEGADAVRLRAIDGSLLVDGIEAFFLRGGNDVLDLGDVEGRFEAYGGPGDDILWGGAGDDVLDGGAGDDWLVGGAGDDFLAAGTGRDRLEGGTGNDRYRIDASAQLRIRDDDGLDGLLWLAGTPDATLMARRVGDDLHLRGDPDTVVEIAAWFAVGGHNEVEFLAGPERWLDLRNLAPQLAADGAPGPDGLPAWAAIPDEIWRPVPSGLYPLDAPFAVA